MLLCPARDIPHFKQKQLSKTQVAVSIVRPGFQLQRSAGTKLQWQLRVAEGRHLPDQGQALTKTPKRPPCPGCLA